MLTDVTAYDSHGGSVGIHNGPDHSMMLHLN